MTVRLSVLDQSPMNAHAFDDMDGFPRQVMEVVGWLDRTLPEEHPYASVCVFALSPHPPHPNPLPPEGGEGVNNRDA
jgi:hypothetical protein